MIVEELFSILNTIGCPVMALATENKTDCVVYQYIPLLSDGIKEQGRLETTAIASDLKTAYSMIENIKSVLLTIGDERKTETILEITQNGGGCLENTDTHLFHLKANFTVKSRVRKG